jgi:sugar lactone lactonase YvrE
MMNGRILWCAALAALAASAVETKYWVLNEAADFEKGNLKKVALRNDGRVTLAPAMLDIFDAQTPYLWAIVEDTKGILYASGGGPGTESAKLLTVDAAGKGRVVTEFDGASVYALAINSKDELFAATSPNGKVYKLTAGKPVVFYDPKQTYVWGMAFDRQDNLYLATGDQGEIHRVEPSGSGKLFFKSDESHARSIAIDKRGNVIVGTEPAGLVLRVSPDGTGFVIYQSQKREITALTVGPNDEIYVAGVGAKQSPGGSTTGVTPVAPTTSSTTPTTSTGPAGAQGQRIAVAPPPTTSVASTTISGGSEVYRISPDGTPVRVFSNGTDVIYAIAVDSKGIPWIGTGNKGGLYRLDTPYLHTKLPVLSSTQATALVARRNGGLAVATGNVGQIVGIGPGLERSGTLESEVLDVAAFSSWGRLANESRLNGGTVVFETRSGNLERPQKNWSPWAPLKDGRVASPQARFLQWRATLAGNGTQSPELRQVDVAYMAKNLPPRIEEVEGTPMNYRSSASAVPVTSMSTPVNPSTMNLPALGRSRPRTPSPPPLSPSSIPSSPLMLTYQKGSVGARWLAIDDNGDSLIYKVEIKGVSEIAWKVLREKVTDQWIAWDSTAFPDGEYQVRVTVSDAPANPPGQGLTASMESEPFTIDNTPPVITNLTAEPASTNMNVRFRVKDVLTVLAKVEYSVDGGEWMIAEPTTRLTDSKEHDYHLVIPRPGVGEILVAVRATDLNDNVATEKTVLKTTQR